MEFNSIAFLLFFPLVFAIHWLIPAKKFQWRNALLLAASYVFYGFWDWRFLGLIVVSTLTDYIAGMRIAKGQKLWLYISLAVNLGLLGTFKYADFFIDSFIDLMALIGINAHASTLNLILPVGISFYTFQTLSYTIDIYRGRTEPTKDLLSFATFVAFFPQLVAGPIERARRLLPQFQKARNFDFKQAEEGVWLVINGFFRKVVLADNFAAYVDHSWAYTELSSASSLLLASLFFYLQIYFDFSGYTNIARGLGKLLGVELSLNFNRPVLANSIQDFWHRWHISLSTWFRDYVYIGLGGNKQGRGRWLLALIAVFVLSGLWHGANLTFLIWGVLHLVLYLIWKGLGIRSVILTQIALLFSWVFFRAPNWQAALDYFAGFGNDWHYSTTNLLQGIGPFHFGLLIFHVLLIPLLYRIEDRLPKKPIERAMLYAGFIVYSLFFYQRGDAFIYFQF